MIRNFPSVNCFSVIQKILRVGKISMVGTIEARMPHLHIIGVLVILKSKRKIVASPLLELLLVLSMVILSLSIWSS